MKISNLFALIPFVLTAGLSIANNAPLTGVYGAELRAAKAKGYLSAGLKIDYTNRELEISLQPVMPKCPEGRFCIQVMPQPEFYELSGLRVSKGECGVVTTVAQHDARPVDGKLFQVVVQDYSKNTCAKYRRHPSTVAEVNTSYYNRIDGKWVNQSFRFEGQALQLIYVSPEPVAPVVPGPGVQEPHEFTGSIVGANYEPKTLVLDLTYQGGCKEHAFELKVEEQCEARHLYNTTVKACPVKIIHTAGYDDFCKALITQSVSFDMSHLGAAYIYDIHGVEVLIH